MAARGSTSGTDKGLDAEPTVAHFVMAELNRQDLLHGWVQQNHDGLPQKAGYRQEDINEIHGSWFDPSNPVVKYTGNLRGDLCEVFSALAKEFGFGPRALGRQRGVTCSADRFCKDTKVLVPYDRHGQLSTSVKTYW